MPVACPPSIRMAVGGGWVGGRRGNTTPVTPTPSPSTGRRAGRKTGGRKGALCGKDGLSTPTPASGCPGSSFLFAFCWVVLHTCLPWMNEGDETLRRIKGFAKKYAQKSDHQDDASQTCFIVCCIES
jgi:glucose-6-phosphate isomerase